MTNTDPDPVSADARPARSYGMVALIIGLRAKPIIVNETIFRKMRKEAA